MPWASSSAIAANQDHDVSFDPTHDHRRGRMGTGWLTKLRERAYLRSRRGRDTVWGPNRTTSEPPPVTLNQFGLRFGAKPVSDRGMAK